jgi:hypothetical protein
MRKRRLVRDPLGQLQPPTAFGDASWEAVEQLGALQNAVLYGKTTRELNERVSRTLRWFRGGANVGRYS